MKRDMDLYRQILLDLEESLGPDEHAGIDNGRRAKYLPNVSAETPVVLEHLRLLLEAGMLRGRLVTSHAGLDGVFVFGITMGGHDFIDNIRSDTVWNKVKDKISTVGGTASVSAVSRMAEQAVNALLG